MLPNEISDIKKYFGKYEDYENLIDKPIELNKSNLILDITKDDFDYYVDEVISLNENNIDLSNLKIIYSPLHGTGYKYIKEIFSRLNANVIYEENEIKEDVNFSYVKNPNPEYEIAYENTLKLMEKEKADLVIVTDPDSDRVGVAFNHNGKIKLINGNENAILITDFLLENKKLKTDKPYYLIYSFVSTSLLAKMCQQKGIKTYITETGFKWIGQIVENNKEKENFFFAFEESYGSLVNERISLDKDAIQSVLLIAMIASLAKKENMNLNDKLENIYSRYGYMMTKAFSYDLKSQEQLEEIKNKFREINFENSTFYDYSKGIRNIEPNNMLSYEFNNTSNLVSLRPSGTEPKFKIYVHVVDETEEKAKKTFDQIFEIIENKLDLKS